MDDIIGLPARIRSMSRRRRKIVLRRRLEKDILEFVGSTNSPLIHAEITRVITGRFEITADVTVNCVVPVDRINLNFKL